MFILLLIKIGVIVHLKKQNTTRIALTVGVPYQLPLEGENISWYSDNPLISVSDAGEVVTTEDQRFPFGQGTIHAYANGSKSPVRSFTFTIVPWSANESKIKISVTNPMLEIFGYKIQYPITRLSTQFILPSMVVYGNFEGNVYFSINRKLYRTSDNFASREKISDLPFRPGKQRMIATPFGYFIRGKKGVYYSRNFDSWELSLKTKHPAWLLDNMDYWYDEKTETAYIYVCEYSLHPDQDHLIYRGVINNSRDPKWETAFTVYSEESMKQDPRKFSKAARHIHLVKVDPYTGDVYFGTGDYDTHAMIRRSTDNGKTFHLVGLGVQEYRTLGFWFTENYIYWNMDQTFPDQMVFRVKRIHLEDKGSLTPLLKTGKTNIGVNYFVYLENTTNFFPVKQGEKYTETEERQLSEQNKVIAVNDPEYNKKELVANLTNGSHWSVFDAKTSNGETVTLLTSTAEGFRRNQTRDSLGRIFGIKENNTGSVTLTELLTVTPYNPKTEKARLEAIAQANDGTIYFQSFHSIYDGSVVAGSLIWNTH